MSLPITPSNREKWLLRIGMDWFIKKYSDGRNSKVIHDEMETCGNPFIRYVQGLKEEMTGNIDEKWQTDMIEKFSEFMLWILYKDTAYRQPFFWAMKKMLDDKDKLMPIIEKYYVEPKDWYVNIWSRGKKETKELKEKGEIGDKGFSEVEKYFVPGIASKRIVDEYVKELEMERKKRGW